jgi:transposase
MKLLYRRCAGLDVHKRTVSACIRIRRHGSKQVEIHEAVFGTFTADLERLRDWLKEHKVKQVAMESTGVYWIPVWNVLEPVRFRFELLLVNPQLVRALRGRKTDRIDAARIAEFLQYGLLHGSFVPPRPIRELRDLTRLRVHLQQDRNRVINRIGRLLETVNVKLGSVVSNIVGKTGRAILKAIVAGRSRPEHLAELAVGSLRNKKPELVLALQGRYNDHFRWLLERWVTELEWLDTKVAELDARLGAAMQPHAELVRRLCTIPGVDRLSAWALIAELGLDMEQFPDARHLASWAGLCPGNSESAGKRFSGRTRKGDRYLRRLLIQNAWAVAHCKDCFLTAVFYRVAQRRGVKKAAVAVAHRILVIAYQILRSGGEYREYGGDYFDRQNPERTVQRLARRLERIGYEVVLRPSADSTAPALSPRTARDARGRPCKCAQRGIPCTHPQRPAPSNRTAPLQPTPQPPVALGPCKRCAQWGIPCIHVRHQKLHAPTSTNPPLSTN